MSRVIRSFAIALLLVATLSVFVNLANGQEYPQPMGYVNDFAHLMTQQEIDTLTVELTDFQAKTTVEIAVVTVSSLQGRSVEDYTTDLFQTWGVGKSGKDNGVILLMAPTEKKVRIEVGFGLESVLTDVQSSRIIRDDIVPAYRAGKPGEAIIAGSRAIMLHLAEPAASAGATADKATTALADGRLLEVIMVFGFILLLVITLVVVVRLFSRLRDRVRFKKENLSILGKCRQLLDQVEDGYMPASAKLRQLKQENPAGVWQDINERFEGLDSFIRLAAQLDNFDDNYAAGNYGPHGARNWLVAFQQKLNGYEQLYNDIGQRLLEVNASRVACPFRLALLPDKIQVAVEAVNHPDVTVGTRQILAVTEKDFQDIQGFLKAEPLTINWLEIRDLVYGVEVALESVMKSVESDKATAVRARTKGPKLLEKMPSILLAAEERAGDSDSAKTRLAEARAQYEKASSLAANTGVNWAEVFLLLSAVQAVCDSIHVYAPPPDPYDNDDTHRPAVVNHNYDNHDDSSMSFGGFGGGRSGGGGATGNL